MTYKIFDITTEPQPMRLPTNPVRKRVIAGLNSWRPSSDWTKDPVTDAQLLIRECQRLVPYVTVMCRNLAEQDILRRVDSNYREHLSSCLYSLNKNLKQWLMSSPYLKENPYNRPVPIKYELQSDGSTMVTFTTKEMYWTNLNNVEEKEIPRIRAGMIGPSGRVSLFCNFDLIGLKQLYPNLLANNSKSTNELDGFMHRWGNPYNTVALKGSSKADGYALIYPTREK